jgi:DNA-binding transcriptional LysR family regulator
MLDDFSQLYPDIILDVSLSDELSALSRDEVDIAIRGGYAPNERVIAIKLMDNQFIPVASPGYLTERGIPSSAIELRQHRGLYYRTPNGPTPWLCEIEGQWQDVSAPQVAVSNNGKWLANKAINGQGIMRAPRWVLKPYLQSGELQELFFTPPLRISQSNELAVYLLYQKHAYLVPKVKVAVDFIVARVKSQ